MNGIELRDVLIPLLNKIPMVERPGWHVHFKTKLAWTVGVLVLYFALTNVPLFGLSSESIDLFKLYRAFYGGSAGSLLFLGVSPIISAWVILQLLVGAEIIKLNMSDPRDQAFYQGAEKLLIFIMIVVITLSLVLGGFIMPDQRLATMLGVDVSLISLVLFIQIALGGVLIYFMDEVVSKWGIGRGVNLIILASISQQLVHGLFNWELDPNGWAIGIIPRWIQIFTRMNLYEILGAGIDFLFEHYVIALITTIIIFLAAVYLECTRLEIPLSHAAPIYRRLEYSYLFSWDDVPGNDSERLLRYLKDAHNIDWAESVEICKSDEGKTIRIFKNENSVEIMIDEKKEKAKVKKEHDKLNIYVYSYVYSPERGARGRFPIKLDYAGSVPIILVWCLITNIQMIGRMAYYKGITILGNFSGSHAISGVMYYLSPIEGLHQWIPSLVHKSTVFGHIQTWQIALHVGTYIFMWVIGSMIFALFWINTTGMGAKDVASQIHRSGMQIPGHRRNPVVIERMMEGYIPKIAILGSLFTTGLVLLASFFGTIGNVEGTAILLAIFIIYRLYDDVASEQMMEMFPAMRRFFGEG
jgi:preprotein translocase subunit SecY